MITYEEIVSKIKNGDYNPADKLLLKDKWKYKAESRGLVLKFRSDLELCYNIVYCNQTKKDLLFQKCWELGSKNGLVEVLDLYYELHELIK